MLTKLLSWSGLLVAYALEILPFRLRAKGLMIMNITVQAILAIGNQTNPVAWANLPKHWVRFSKVYIPLTITNSALELHLVLHNLDLPRIGLRVLCFPRD